MAGGVEHLIHNGCARSLLGKESLMKKAMQLYHNLKMQYDKIYQKYRRPVLRLYFFLSVKWIYYVIDTTPGYTLYCLSCFLIFIIPAKQYFYSWAFFAAFLLFTLGQISEMWILTNIPVTRRYLDQLLGADFIIKHLGK